VKVNYNLVEAAEEFGLKTKPLDDELVAIWDGKEFIFEESQWKFWSILKGLRRWGLSPLKVQGRKQKNCTTEKRKERKEKSSGLDKGVLTDVLYLLP